MAEEVSRVAQRCEEAKQSLVLDLSYCELMSLPEAIFFILKNVELHEVNLSHNKLKKLPKKFSSRFSRVTCEPLTIHSLHFHNYCIAMTHLKLYGDIPLAFCDHIIQIAA